MDNGSDKWFRWSINTFVFLVCFQFGMLLYFKSLFYQAEQQLKDNEVKVPFTCTDFHDEESYWRLPASTSEINYICQDKFCPDSFWKNETDQSESLQIVSIKQAIPGEKSDGRLAHLPFVDVKVYQSDKPIVLVLVAHKMMLWNLHIDKNSKLKEVILVGPELVWVEGLPKKPEDAAAAADFKDVKLTYFPKETICSYPTGWEELKNPENQFRRLYRALYEYTGLTISGFQGKDLAREVRVPFRSPLLEDRLRTNEEKQRQLSSESTGGMPSLGVQYQRHGKSLKSDSFHYLVDGKIVKVKLPEAVVDGHFDSASKQLFVISNHRFGTWDWEKEKFTNLPLPLAIPEMHWPTAMAHNPLTNEIYVYNDDRGGEINAFSITEKKWKTLAQKVGYTFVALHFDKQNQMILGTRATGQKIDELVKFNHKGEVVERFTLPKALDFSKNRWKAHIISDQSDYWLKVTHPAHPGGDIYPLSQTGQAM